jgi:hypothetical protein
MSVAVAVVVAAVVDCVIVLLFLLCTSDFGTDVAQTFEQNSSGLRFGRADLCFWDYGTYKLGQETNGYTHLGHSFAVPAEGPFALNNGERAGFVFTAFQVLLVKSADGLIIIGLS